MRRLGWLCVLGFTACGPTVSEDEVDPACAVEPGDPGVPDDAELSAEIGPCHGSIFGCCGPADGPILGLALGDELGCGTSDTSVLLAFDREPAAGYFELAMGDYGWVLRDGAQHEIANAWVNLTALDESGASGVYDLVTVDGIHLSGAFDRLPICPLPE